jgi:chaperone required for assembly of F1-ATPase
MSAWAAKRFWTDATVEAVDGGYTVRLDARAVKTPLKALLVVPTRVMAEAIAAEWQAQIGLVRPGTMPVTRSANSAIDKVAAQFDEVVGLIAAYGGSDLLCYRATFPPALIARQAAAWDPLLDWAADALTAPLRSTLGVIHIPQDERSLAALHARVAAMTVFQIAGFHDLVAISGSLIVALAVTEGRLTPDEAWTCSRIDEAWQNEQWGIDEDAAAMEVTRRAAFDHAGRFYGLCG